MLVEVTWCESCSESWTHDRYARGGDLHQFYVDLDDIVLDHLNANSDCMAWLLAQKLIARRKTA